MSDEHINFRIGVTGHRDIHPDDIETTHQQATEFLTRLQSLMPETGITVISGLADGADRIFAEAALALDMKVEAVLPMPLLHYKNDFGESSFAELERLLKLDSVRCIELPLTSGLGADEDSWPSGARDALYANLSEDLRLRSSVLVAIWDGIFNHLKGGTGDTLMAYLGVTSGTEANEIKFVDASDTLLEDGSLLYWIPVKRSSTGQASSSISAAQASRWLSAAGENIRWWPSAPSDFEQKLMQFDQANQHHTEPNNS